MSQTPTDSLPLSKSGRTALDVAMEAAELAGQIIVDRFDSTLDIRFKGKNDIVTDVDLAA